MFLQVSLKNSGAYKKDLVTISYPEIMVRLLFENLYPHPNPLSGKEREF